MSVVTEILQGNRRNEIRVLVCVYSIRSDGLTVQECINRSGLASAVRPPLLSATFFRQSADWRQRKVHRVVACVAPPGERAYDEIKAATPSTDLRTDLIPPAVQHQHSVDLCLSPRLRHRVTRLCIAISQTRQTWNAHFTVLTLTYAAGHFPATT